VVLGAAGAVVAGDSDGVVAEAVVDGTVTSSMTELVGAGATLGSVDASSNASPPVTPQDAETARSSAVAMSAR